MEILRHLIEPSLESALADIGVKGDFWKKALGVSREKDQGDLSLPCFPFAKQLAVILPKLLLNYAIHCQVILMSLQQADI
jgi:hypothetical protein